MKLPSKLIVLWAFLQVTTVSEACKSYSEDCKDEIAAYSAVSTKKDDDACEKMLAFNDCTDAAAEESGAQPNHCSMDDVAEKQEWCPAYCAGSLASPSAVLTACLALAATASLMAA